MTRPAYVVLALWPNGRPRALVHVLALVSYELAVSVGVRVASARQHWDVCGLVACPQPEILFQEESCKRYGKRAFPAATGPHQRSRCFFFRIMRPGQMSTCILKSTIIKVS